MTLTYPRKWAEAHNFLRDRTTLQNAIRFVESVQSAAFGELIAAHNQTVDAGHPPDDDPSVQTEKQLQQDLDVVLNWLQMLEQDGQQTISTDKVITQIERQTGYDFRLTDS